MQVISIGNHQYDALITLCDYESGDDICEVQMLFDANAEETLDIGLAVEAISHNGDHIVLTKGHFLRLEVRDNSRWPEPA